MVKIYVPDIDATVEVRWEYEHGKAGYVVDTDPEGLSSIRWVTGPITRTTCIFRVEYHSESVVDIFIGRDCECAENASREERRKASLACAVEGHNLFRNTGDALEDYVRRSRRRLVWAAYFAKSYQQLNPRNMARRTAAMRRLLKSHYADALTESGREVRAQLASGHELVQREDTRLMLEAVHA